MTRCETLQQGGRKWRLPSRIELASLLDFGGLLVLPDLAPDSHWSSSKASGPNRAWSVTFSTPYQFFFTEDLSFAARVICVTGDSIEIIHEVGEDTIRDEVTDLVWQKTESASGMGWNDALNHCEGMSLAGSSDWRLPSAKEALAFSRDDQQWPATLSQNGSYWTSSPGPFSNRAHDIYMPSGENGDGDPSDLNLVRCVRGPEAQ